MRGGFLATDDDDQTLEEANLVFWDALIAHVRADGFEQPPFSIVDVGSHRGGLLERLARIWRPTVLVGIEPVPALRKRALLRLRSQAKEVQMLDPAEWSQVPSASVDRLFSVEALQFVEDADSLIGNIARVLRPGSRAYLVLGCHSENPAWIAWKPQLEAMGHRVFSHRPMDILRAAAGHGCLPSARPLRRDGWITHDPRDPIFTFESAEQMIEHHFKHKLVFRLAKP